MHPLPPHIAEAQPVFETRITSLPLVARGKVRDIYAVGDDRLLMVATDRVSAFDRVLPDPIPGKGRVLTQMSLFWFERFADLVPNHLTGEAPESVVRADERDQVAGRSMLVHRLEPILAEAVVRGYLAGSGWGDYQRSGAVCGISLPAGLRKAERLAQPIFTPAVKAPVGEHDENCSFDDLTARIGSAHAQRIRELAVALYQRAQQIAEPAGILVADTKFEFGVDAAGHVVLMDEALTPDSSRFWRAADWQPGQVPDSLDKQPLRDWLSSPEHAGRIDSGDLPRVPPALARRLIEGYWDVYQRIVDAHQRNPAARPAA